ncbi:MAG: class I SAM-dependent methyltransferase [Bacteroidales bacterium]
MNPFDARARDWDNNPLHWERSEVIASEMLKRIPVSPHFTALEFGAGTGILSFLMAPLFSEITMLDNSPEMVRVMSEKVQLAKTLHLQPLCCDIEKVDCPGLHADLLFSQMAMHHVCDVAEALHKFFGILNKGGYLAITDLYSEDGSFHGASFTGHKGFDPKDFEMMLSKAGFSDISIEPCFLQKKPVDGSLKAFPLFLAIARKL